MMCQARWVVKLVTSPAWTTTILIHAHDSDSLQPPFTIYKVQPRKNCHNIKHCMLYMRESILFALHISLQWTPLIFVPRPNYAQRINKHAFVIHAYRFRLNFAILWLGMSNIPVKRSVRFFHWFFIVFSFFSLQWSYVLAGQIWDLGQLIPYMANW